MTPPAAAFPLSQKRTRLGKEGSWPGHRQQMANLGTEPTPLTPYSHTDQRSTQTSDLTASIPHFPHTSQRSKELKCNKVCFMPTCIRLCPVPSELDFSEAFQDNPQRAAGFSKTCPRFSSHSPHPEPGKASGCGNEEAWKACVPVPKPKCKP